MVLASGAHARFGGEYGMEAKHREKRPEPKDPLEGTLEYDLYVNNLTEEIIELTEAVEEKSPPGKDGASATQKPVGPPEQVGSNLSQEVIELTEVVEEAPLSGKDGVGATCKPLGSPEQVRLIEEKPDLDRKGREHRSEPIPGAIPPLVPGKGQNRLAKERQPELTTSTEQAFPAATENSKPVAGHHEVENQEADRIFAEFFASLDPSDLAEQVMETDGPSHRPIVEEPPRVEDDALEKLLEELESTELAFVKETSDSLPPAEKPVVRGELRETLSAWSGTRCRQRSLALDKENARCQNEMASQISQLRTQQEKLKSRYNDIRSLLYATDDQLKSTVASVFRTFWKVQVSDLESRKGAGFKDDILVEHEGRKIIFKIKSTASSNPPIKHVTEIWQELHYSGLGEQAEGGLILNYDISNDPSERRLAFTGADEEYLDDLILVDTRVLYDLTLAVAEYGLPLQSATDLLLKKGRVKFHLDDVAR